MDLSDVKSINKAFAVVCGVLALVFAFTTSELWMGAMAGAFCVSFVNAALIEDD